jgi:hypothetical protein
MTATTARKLHSYPAPTLEHTRHPEAIKTCHPEAHTLKLTKLELQKLSVYDIKKLLENSHSAPTVKHPSPPSPTKDHTSPTPTKDHTSPAPSRDHTDHTAPSRATPTGSKIVIFQIFSLNY